MTVKALSIEEAFARADFLEYKNAFRKGDGRSGCLQAIYLGSCT